MGDGLVASLWRAVAVCVSYAALTARPGVDMRHHPFVLICACALAAPVRSLCAQTIPDTVTASFRQGEWGVGFILRTNVTEAGVLRFSTPTRAWVLDGSASFDWQSLSGSAVLADRRDRSSSVSAQFGPRWYHALSGHVVRYLGF